MTDATGPMPASPPPYGSSSTPPEVPPRPAVVEASFWLYLAGAALSLIGTVIAISAFGALRNEAIQQAQRELEAQGQGDVLPEGTFEAIIDATFGVGIALGLLLLAVYVVFAFLVRRGHNWARITLTVLVGLAVLFTLLGLALSALPVPASARTSVETPGASTVLSLLQQVCVVVATVLAWLPAANAWFRQVKARRLSQRGGGFGSSAPRSA